MNFIKILNIRNNKLKKILELKKKRINTVMRNYTSNILSWKKKKKNRIFEF